MELLRIFKLQRENDHITIFIFSIAKGHDSQKHIHSDGSFVQHARSNAC